MIRNKTTKEILDFARMVSKESLKDNAVYDISIDYTSKNVLTRAIREVKKIAKFTLQDYKLGVKTMADIMVKILMKGAKAIGKTAVILIIWIAHKLENK